MLRQLAHGILKPSCLLVVTSSQTPQYSTAWTRNCQTVPMCLDTEIMKCEVVESSCEKENCISQNKESETILSADG